MRYVGKVFGAWLALTFSLVVAYYTIVGLQERGAPLDVASYSEGFDDGVASALATVTAAAPTAIPEPPWWADVPPVPACPKVETICPGGETIVTVWTVPAVTRQERILVPSCYGDMPLYLWPEICLWPPSAEVVDAALFCIEYAPDYFQGCIRTFSFIGGPP